MQSKEERYKEAIKWGLYHSGAASFSDEEINKWAKNTCTPKSNAKRAKQLRDKGLLKYSKIEAQSILD